jgi:hypothetical protein
MSEVPLYSPAWSVAALKQATDQAISPSHSWIPIHFIAASIYDEDLVGPGNRKNRTRCCFTIFNMIQVCSNFH